jgi:hypothetical protein
MVGMRKTLKIAVPINGSEENYTRNKLHAIWFLGNAAQYCLFVVGTLAHSNLLPITKNHSMPVFCILYIYTEGEKMYNSAMTSS